MMIDVLMCTLILVYMFGAVVVYSLLECGYTERGYPTKRIDCLSTAILFPVVGIAVIAVWLGGLMKGLFE